MNKYLYYGHLPRKRYGQNFLCDIHIIESIVTAICPKPDEAIVEIGPGLGSLTEKVIKHLNSMTAIEIDKNLSNFLKKHPLIKNKLNIFEKDVMQFDFLLLYNNLKKPLRIFGNLPYNISTQLIFYLLNYTDIILDMHFMLQKEVVSRLIAIPNSKSYGRLSIMAQFYYKITKLINVPMKAFKPIPKVESAVVRLIPYKIPPYELKDINIFTALINIAFNQRRKTIRNSLSSLFNKEQLMEHNIDSELRAENLSIDQYCRLANSLTER